MTAIRMISVVVSERPLKFFIEPVISINGWLESAVVTRS